MQVFFLNYFYPIISFFGCDLLNCSLIVTNLFHPYVYSPCLGKKAEFEY